MWTAEEALKHHGILGQKWGKKNGPPYPLGASDHSDSEKKAGYQKSIKGGSSDSEKKEHKGLTDKQKKYLKIGAIAVGSTLVVAGGVALAKSGQLDKVIHRGKNELSKQGIIQMDLQKFAKKRPDKPFRFANNQEKARAYQAFKSNNVSRDNFNKDFYSTEVETGKGAYRYTAYKGEDGEFVIFSKTRVKKSATKIYERVKNGTKKKE